MKLTQAGDRASGPYTAHGGGTFEGTISADCSWQGNWANNDGVRRGTFSVAQSADGQVFAGSYVTEGIPQVILSARRNSAGAAGTYLGCFPDDASRDLNGFSTSFGDMTIEGCNATCQVKGFIYAGTQFGSYCFCGNTVGRIGAAVESRCQYPCSGNAQQICGGNYANSVRKPN
jgi:hypothetical protein